MNKQYLRRVALAFCIGALTGCAPADYPPVETSPAPYVDEAADAPAATDVPTDASQRELKPSAQGDADTSGLSPDQIETMFATAFAQQRPFEDHRAVCLIMIRSEGGGWPRDPPAYALEAFGKLTELPVLPGSQCSSEIFPYVIESAEKAMLYSIRIESIARNDAVTFWGSAVCGNLCAYGSEFSLKRHGDKWHAEPTGRRAVS